jgi:hypothetical protein
MIHTGKNQKIKRRRLDVSDPYLDVLENRGEISIDKLGRVRGFDGYIKRDFKNKGWL